MNKKTIKYIFVFLSYFVYDIYIYLFLKLINIDINNLNNIKKNIAFFTIDLIYFLILLFIYRKELKEYKNNFSLSLLSKYLPIYLLGVILMGLSNTILTQITGIELASNEENIRTLIKYYPIYMFFSSVIYAPIVEELIFRKSIDIFKNKTIFIITSGLLFGLIHVVGNSNESLNEILMGIPYIIMGIDFAYIYSKSKNIFTTISMHSLHNFILIIIQYLGG